MIELTKQEAIEISWEDCDPEVYKIVQSPKRVGERRWEDDYEVVFEHIPSGKFYALYFSRGKTEMQETLPFEYDREPIKPTEVRKVEVTVTKWEAV